MKINLLNRIFCIFGLNMSGKTYLAKHIARQYNSLIFDVLGEYEPNIYDVYIPSSKIYPDIAQEFDLFIDKVKDKKWNMLIVDEASRIFPNKRPLYPAFRSYLDTYRHHKLCSIGFIARRPTQLHTDLVELSHYIFVFNLKGKNDIQYLNFLNSEIGDLPAKLEPYHFMVIYPDRSFKIFKPVS